MLGIKFPHFAKGFVVLILFFWWSSGQAHLDDEFCSEGGVDPALCAALAELDSSEPGIQAVVELERSPWETLRLYVHHGVVHILPAGADHLLFVLMLVLSSAFVKPLLIQISLFTLAHTVSLAAVVFGTVALGGKWVEVLIAASIAVVAFEAMLMKPLVRVPLWRLGLIFGFGLLHGLGFAGALQETGLPSDHRVMALLGFNLGVELAQVGFAVLAYWGLVVLCRDKAWYRQRIVLPLCLMVACVATFWALDRMLGA